MSALLGRSALMLALAHVPVALCLWQAQFSRMLKDDFLHIALGKELGAWQLWLHFRSIWAGSYSDYFHFGSLAHLDSALPSVAVLFSIVFWLAGTAVLAGLVLARITNRQSRVTALGISALIVGAAISAIQPEVFYWYAANTRYVLPLAVLTIYFALALYVAGRELSKARKIVMSMAATAICFIAAGFSEMSALYQFALLLLAIFASIACADRKARAPIVYWLGLGMLGTCIGFLVHFNAPGFYSRLENPASATNPIRSVFALLDRSLDAIIQLAGDPEVFRGFTLLFFVGLLAALLLHRSNKRLKAPDGFNLARGPLLFGLIAQLLLLPFLWTHVSDNGQVFGRFSYRYASIVFLNAAFIIFFAFLLWRRQRLDLAIIQRHKGRLCSAFLSAILLQFALTQVPSIDVSASFYLHMSAVTAIVAFAGSMSFESRRGLRNPLLFHTITAILLLIIVLATLYLQGFMIHRVLVAVIAMHIVAGAVWGFYTGIALNVHVAGGARRLHYYAFLIALVIGMQISLSLAGKIPNMATYAREWDRRHHTLLEARAAGLRELELPRSRFLLHRLEVWQDFDHGRRSFEKTYYGLAQFACHKETCRYVFRLDEDEDL